MKSQVEWQDELKLFEAVAGALDIGLEVIEDEHEPEEDAEVRCFDEEGPYGERGYILISYKGRRFSLELYEIT